MPNIHSEDDFKFIQGPEGRLALVIGGITFELGKSGLREILPGPGASAGRVSYERNGLAVTVNIEGIQWSGSGNLGAVGGRAAPRVTKFIPVLSTDGTSTARFGVAPTSGTISLLNAVVGKIYSGTLTYLTDVAWWDDSVKRPGVPYGDPLVA